MYLRLPAAILLGLFLALPIRAERLKDIASVAGVRDNQLIGYGMVVGLAGTGDKTNQTKFTIRTFRNMLRELGVNVPLNPEPKVKNVAAVMVTATLPPFAKPGQRIDVTINSIGDASSLRGGTLLLTPLKGADGRVYAMAQGNLTVGGFGAEADDGSKITVNIPTSGRIPGGATVERTVASPFANGNSLVINLHRPDFTTANRVALAIDEAMGGHVASAVDGSSVRVQAPRDESQRVAFISILENIEVVPAEAPARVVVNSRTGTVVIGRHVRVTEAAVAHGSLMVTITSEPQVSQPPPLSGGTTVVVPRTNIDVTEEESRMFLFNPGVSLDDIVRAVNGVGAAPGDLVAILEALREAGALKAELIVI